MTKNRTTSTNSPSKAKGSDLWVFIQELKHSGLTPQQKRTLRGQAIVGDLEGAKKGFQTLMRRKQKHTNGRAM